MHWIQYRAVDGALQRFVRYKCGRCGTTILEPASDPQSQPRTIPEGWAEANRAQWSICPECLKKEFPLPLLH